MVTSRHDGPGFTSTASAWFTSRETVPRVAFVRLAPGPVFVSFPTHYEPPPIWSGVAMRPGEIVFHGRGEPMHQRTHGATGWGLIALAPEDLAPYGPALARVGLAPPWPIRILQPPATVVAGLLRRHGDACRLAESTPDRVMDQKVARALEQDLLDALVTCLTAGEGYGLTGARRHHAQIMARFEDVLACHRSPGAADARAGRRRGRVGMPRCGSVARSLLE